MNVLFDTSALLALYVENHPNHNLVLDYFIDRIEADDDLFISTHTLAEFYRHVTSGRRYFMYQPEHANQIIKDDITERFNPIALETDDYLSVISKLNDLTLSGAIIYDALIARAAEKSNCEKLVTFNIKDFSRVWPLTNADLIEP